MFSSVQSTTKVFANPSKYSKYLLLNFEGSLRWTLIVLFMFSKAALIMSIFMHLFWERYAIVNVLLWPMTLMMLFVWIMVAESEYTLLTRIFYFILGS